MSHSTDFQSIENPFQAPIYYKKTTDSTMIDAARLVPPAHGIVIAAGFQTKGRGRGQNRNWESDINKNLLFTIVLDPAQISHPLVRVPLICGMALVRFLSNEYQLKLRLKWPNDVLVDKKKISGILCEYKNGMILAGMGINCHETIFSESIRNKSTSLKLQGIEDSPQKILAGFLPILKETLEDNIWKNEAQEILFGWGESIKIQLGSAENSTLKTIKIKGLNDDGFLIATGQENNEEMIISTGEIRFADFI